MDDVITDIPPPSRFFAEELNNFAPSSPHLPSPFLVFSESNPTFRPSLLIIAISLPSVQCLHYVSSKSHVGTLIVPEISLSGNSIEPNLKDKSCNIYTLQDGDKLTMIVSFQYSVPIERSLAVANLLIGKEIIPERVLILDSVQSRNYRGKLSPDEAFAFKMETSAERKAHVDSQLLKGLDYFPSGSVVDGLGAALLSRCQLKKIKGTLCLTWPEFGPSAVSLIKSLLKEAVPGIQYGNTGNANEFPRFSYSKGSPLDSELYT
ncbi:hypothetical protein LIER_42743 [Lithospermum erythrorhizon]|uniref:Proteasome assembly chaperone 1 n=1 Tax=Lithospermum erythrorhizon TaxID=34254 RepID=A0AAV3NY46_LITER